MRELTAQAEVSPEHSVSAHCSKSDIQSWLFPTWPTSHVARPAMRAAAVAVCRQWGLISANVQQGAP